jgi:hypothetical protein
VQWFGHVGLAFGTSFAALLNGLYLYLRVGRLLRDAGGILDFNSLARSFLVHFSLAFLMGGGCWITWSAFLQPVSQWLIDSSGYGFGGIFAVRVLGVGVLVFEGVLITLLMARLFKVQETNEAIQFFWSKVKNKLKRRPIQG